MEQKNNSKQSSTENVPNQIDLTSILNATIAVSEQLLPEKLAETLVKIIMKESGADKGFILVSGEKQLSVIAEFVKNDGSEMKINAELKVPDYNFIPEKIILEAQSEQLSIVIDDFSTDKKYHSDKYFLTHQPKSIFCLPIVKEKKTIGIVYLENNQSTGAFTPEKIISIKILATQAAISYENLTLFNKLDISTKRFQDIMDNSTAVVFAKLLNGNYIFINKEFEKLYKVSREKVIRLDNHDIFPKDFADAFVSKDKLIAETGKALTYEEKIPHDDGLHTYIIAKFPLLDAAGKIYAVAGIGTDITDLKRLEESLRENQNRFNYVLAATQDSIYDWDLVSGRIWRNEQYERLFDGPTGGNIDWWKHNIHPDEFADVESRLQNAFGKLDRFWNQEYRFKKVTGGYAYVIDRGFIIYDSQQKPIRMIGALMDITERKQFIDDLERSLALSRATLESTADGILVVNTERKIEGFNNKFIQMWGIPDSIIETRNESETIGFILNQLKDPDRFVVKIRELYADPEAESFDIIEFKDGRVFERYSKPQKTKSKTIGRVWSFRDISERRKQQEAEKHKIILRLFRQQELLKLASFKDEQSLEEKFKMILAADAKVLDVERVSICFFNENKTQLSSSVTYSLSKNSFLPGVFLQKNDYPRFFLELDNNRIIDANDAQDDARTADLSDNYLNPLGIVSLMSIPIRTTEQVIGVVLHEQIAQKRKWTYEEQAFAYSIADIVTLAFENEEKLRIMNSLIESEQRFRLAISQLPILFAVFDINLKWSMAGGKILEKLGMKSQNLIGKTLYQTSEELDINIIHHNEALQGKSSSYEYKFGETYLQRFVEPLKNTVGKIVGVISMSLDITEQTKAEEEIKRLNKKLEQSIKDTSEQLNLSQNVFQIVVENIKEYCFITLDTNGNIKSWNKGAERIHGYPAEEIIGNNFALLYTDQEIKNGEPEKNLKEAIKNGHVENTGWRKRKDGSTFWANAIITPLPGNGNIKGFIKITRDVEQCKNDGESDKNKN